MSKDQAGRKAGHHLTPGQGWRWQDFGGSTLLVTDGGGADVVLGSRHCGGGRSQLTTCAPSGNLVPIHPSSPMGLLLESIPELVEVALAIHASDDRPNYLPRLDAALRAAGLI